MADTPEQAMALVDSNGVVVNIIVWSESSTYVIPDGHAVEQIDGSLVYEIGLVPAPPVIQGEEVS